MSARPSEEDRTHVMREIRSLEEQLAQLRRSLVMPSADAGLVEVLQCRLAGTPIAFPVQDVVEVVPFCHLDPLPEAPASVLGVLNLRQRLIPVRDLRVDFQWEESAPSIDDMIIVCEAAGRSVGLITNEVLETNRVALDSLEQDVLIPGLGPYLVGSYPRGDVPVYLLSVATLLAPSRA